MTGALCSRCGLVRQYLFDIAFFLKMFVDFCMIVQTDSWEHICLSHQLVLTRFLCCTSLTDLPAGWEEGYTFEGARCFIK